jgi:uncharacterized membrane protein YhaH (DUF805 family)
MSGASLNVADVAFASVLALAAVLATILVARAGGDARRQVRFASALYGALAFADLLATVDGTPSASLLTGAVALIVMALAPVALALAFSASFEARPAPAVATVTLVLGCAAGLAAAMTGARFIAMAALFASVCAILTFAIRRWRASSRSAIQAMICGFALLAGAAAELTGGLEAYTSLALFSAAALLGAALACGKRSNVPVEEPALPRSNVITLVRRER